MAWGYTLLYELATLAHNIQDFETGGLVSGHRR